MRCGLAAASLVQLYDIVHFGVEVAPAYLHTVSAYRYEDEICGLRQEIIHLKVVLHVLISYGTKVQRHKISLDIQFHVDLDNHTIVLKLL